MKINICEEHGTHIGIVCPECIDREQDNLAIIGRVVMIITIAVCIVGMVEWADFQINSAVKTWWR